MSNIDRKRTTVAMQTRTKDCLDQLFLEVNQKLNFELPKIQMLAVIIKSMDADTVIQLIAKGVEAKLVVVTPVKED